MRDKKVLVFPFDIDLIDQPKKKSDLRVRATVSDAYLQCKAELFRPA